MADPRTHTATKKKIILTPGGSGSLGGVIIRSLLRWDPYQVQQKTKTTSKKKKKKSPHHSKTSKKKKKTSPKKQKASPQKKNKKPTKKKSTPSQKKKRVTPEVPAAAVVSPPPPPSSSSSPVPWMMMPAKPDLKSVFPHLMRTWKPVSRGTQNITTSTQNSEQEALLAKTAAAKKVASTKTKVQNRTGMLQSLLDLSKQELSRFNPLTIKRKPLIEPLRSSIVSQGQKLKLIRLSDNQWRRIPV